MKNQNILPFIFARLTPESQATCFMNHGAGNFVIQDWVVKIATSDLRVYNCTWMADEELGDFCFIPDVDISKEEHVFPTFEKAQEFVKQWWINN